jgi:hypothetical protein
MYKTVKSFVKENFKIFLLAILYLVLGVLIAPLPLDIFFHFSTSIFSNIKLSDVVTMLAAFGGSLSAFIFQRRNEKTNIRNKRIDALRKASFIYAGQYNKIKYLVESHFDTYRNNPLRWSSMPPFQPLNYSHLFIDFGQLEFLLADYGDSMMNLQLAQESFFTAIQTINSRSTFHLNEFQPKVSQAQSDFPDTKAGNEEYIAFLGERIYQTLLKATNESFISFDYARNKLLAAAEDLWVISKELYPNEKFLCVKDEGPEKSL